MVVGLVSCLSREAFEISPGDPDSRVHWSAASGIWTRHRAPEFYAFPYRQEAKSDYICGATVRADSCCESAFLVIEVGALSVLTVLCFVQTNYTNCDANVAKDQGKKSKH